MDMKMMKTMVLIVVALVATINLAVSATSYEVTNPKLIAALTEYADAAPNADVRFWRLQAITAYLVTAEEKIAYLDSLLPDCKVEAQKTEIALCKASILNAQGRVKDAVVVYEAQMDAGNYAYIRQIVQNEPDPVVALKYKKAYLLNQLGVRAPALNSNELLFVLKSIRPDECDDYKAFLDDVLRFYRVFMVDSPNLIPFITQVEATRNQLGNSPAVTPVAK
jgi:hypothetical protein